MHNPVYVNTVLWELTQVHRVYGPLSSYMFDCPSSLCKELPDEALVNAVLEICVEQHVILCVV